MKEDAYRRFCLALGKHEQFKMRLPTYDGGSHFFWPCYIPSERLFLKETIAIARWYDRFEIGIIQGKVPDKFNTWSLNLVVPSEKQNKLLLHMIAVPRADIIAVLMPE